jgi:hypothetical protein
MEHHPWTECQAEFLAVVAAFHNIVHISRGIPVKGVVLFEGEADGNHNGAEFSKSVSPQHQ